MRTRASLAMVLCLCLPVSAAAAPAGQPDPTPGESAKAQPLPGVELAEALATATGIAITPLLGVSVVGAWKAWRTPPELRHSLPWYASTWFWAPGLAIALLLVFKDPVLGVLPGAKKPLDAVDVIENKASALLAAPAVVPMVVTAARAARGMLPAGGEEAPEVSQAGLAALPGWVGELPEMILLGLGIGLFLVAFFCVWLAFHAINVLILLSPFGPLDTLLRMVKLLVLVVLAAATWVHPYLGALVALAIVLVSIPLAGWSFRLMVFGGVLAWDLVTWRHRRLRQAPWVRAFVAERLGRARGRAYGRVSLSEEGLCFSHRPWLLLPRRTVVLPAGRYDLGRGLVCPVIRLRREDGSVLEVLRLPPRYRYHEEEIVERFGLAGVEDLGLRRGIKAVVAFVREMAGRGGRGAARLAGGEGAREPGRGPERSPPAACRASRGRAARGGPRPGGGCRPSRCRDPGGRWRRETEAPRGARQGPPAAGPRGAAGSPRD